jgi:hypothetical protein
VKLFDQIFVRLCSVVGVLGLTSCFTRPPLVAGYCTGDAASELASRLAVQPQPSVLFIGNSYSFGVPAAFKKLAAAHGKTLRIGHSTYGGWSLAQHAAHPFTLQKISEGKWDIIVIQEQSEIPAKPALLRNPAMFPPLQILVKAAREHGAIPILYQTWGRRDGDPKRRKDSFQAMTRRLRQGYEAAAKNAGGLVIVAAGDAWLREIEAGRGQQLFCADGSHPTAQGNELTAKCFYQVLFPNGRAY